MSSAEKTLVDLTGHYSRRVKYKKRELITESQEIIDKMQALIARLNDSKMPSQAGELQDAANFNALCGELNQIMRVMEDLKGWTVADGNNHE